MISLKASGILKLLIFYSVFVPAMCAYTQENVFSKDSKEELSSVYYSSYYLEKLYTTISESEYLIKNWVFIDRMSDTPDKLKLKAIHTSTIPDLLFTLQKLSSTWEIPDKSLLTKTEYQIDTLLAEQQYIMELLGNFEDYEDTFIMFEASVKVETSGLIHVITDEILNNIEILLNIYRQKLNIYLLPLDSGKN